MKKKDSDDIFNIFFNNSIDLLCIADTNGYFKKLNIEWEKTLGYKLSELEGKAYIDFVHPDDVEDTIKATTQLANNESVQNFTNRYRHKNGTYRWIEWRSFPVGNMIYASARDITENKIKTEEILENEKFLRRFTQNIPGTVFQFVVNDNEKYSFNYVSDNSKKYLELDNNNLDTFFDRFLNILPKADHSDFLKSIQMAVENNSVWDYEGKFIKKSTGELNYYHGTAHQRKIGSRYIFDGILFDITDRKLAEIQLRKSETQYRALIEDQVDLVSRYLPDTTLTFVNDAYCKFYGKKREELIGQSYLFMIAPEFRELVKKETMTLAKNNASVKGEYLNYRYDGKECWIQWAVKCITDENGKVIELQAVGRDITEIKNTEEALKQSEGLLKGIALNIPGTVFQFRAEKNGKYGFNYVSDNSVHYLGLDNKNLDNFLDRFLKRLPEEEHQAFRASIDSAAINESTWKYEGTFIKPDGEKRYFRCISEPRKIKDTLVFDGIYLDITETKQAEKELEYTKTLLSASVMQSPIPMVIVSAPDYKVRFTNIAAGEILGIEDISKYIGKSLLEIEATWQDYDEQGNFIPLPKGPLALALQGIDTKNRELTIIRKDGTVRHESATATAIRNNNGDIIAAYLVFPDITDRKLAEEALRLNQFSIDSSSSSYIWVDDEAIIVYVNDAACSSVGYTREELLGMKIFEIDPDFPAEGWEEHKTQLRAQKKMIFESRHQTKDGRIFPVEITSNYIEYNGRFFACTFDKDITERKKAEEELLKNQKMLTESQRIARLGSWEMDLSDFSVTWSKETYEIFGFKASDSPVNMDKIYRFVHPDDREHVKNIVEHSLKTKKLQDFECRIIQPNGEIVTILTVGEILTDDKGKPARMLGAVQNITERKKAEEDLLKNQKMLTESQRIARIGSWDMDLIDFSVIWSKETYEIFGLRDKEIPVTLEVFFKYIYKDDKEFVKEHVNNAIKNNKLDDFECRILSHDKIIKTVLIVGEFLLDEKGKALRLFGVVQDITERKKEQEALLKNQKMLTDSQRIAHVGSWELNLKNNNVIWNDETYNIFGITEKNSQLTLENFMQVLHPDDIGLIKNVIDEALGKNKIENFECRIIRPNGDIRNVYATGEVSVDEKGKPSHILGIVQDITERKKVDEELVQQRNKLEGIFRVAPTGIGVVINRVLTEINQQICEITGYSKEELLGKSSRVLYPSDEEYEYVGKMKYQQISEKGTGIVETVWKRKDGSLMNILLASTPLEANNMDKGVTFTALDITKRKKAEEEIKKLNAELEARVIERTSQLEQANKDLESFAYSVSHDLRAPLRHIDGFANMMYSSMQQPEKNVKGYYEKINIASKRMSSMIDDLLTFSRLGRRDLMLSSVNLDRLIKDVIIQFKPDYENRKINWKVEELPIVPGDEGLLQIAFGNIISNAIKYTSQKDEANIEIGQSQVSDKKVTVYVKDNGVGFNMTYADKLFGVFQRLHSTNEFEGTGIGLANVKQIITKHNGTITAKSEINKGATFYITFQK